jgi:Fe-S-cluster-containing hydrogenase component 2
MAVSSRPKGGPQPPRIEKTEISEAPFKPEPGPKPEPGRPTTSAPLPLLSGLDGDEWEDIRPRPLKPALPSRPNRTVAPTPPPPGEDLFSDTPTRVAPIPVPPAASIDAASTSAAAGALDVPIKREKSDHPEPTITVAEDLLTDLGVLPDAATPQPSAPAPASRPAPAPAASRPIRPPPPASAAPPPPAQPPSVEVPAWALATVMEHPTLPPPAAPRAPAAPPPSVEVPAWANETVMEHPTLPPPAAPLPTLGPGAEEPGADATRIIAMSAVEMLGRNSVPVPTNRADAIPLAGMSGALPTLGQDAPPGGQEATRIVSSLTLKELNEPRARRTRSQPLVPSGEPAKGMSGPRSLDLRATRGGQPKTPSRPDHQTGAAVSGEPATDDTKQKKNLISLIKARTRAKVAPVDPSRILFQQEAAERKASEERVNLAGLGRDDLPQEGTIIGRFLGLVGLGAGGESRAPVAAAKDEKTLAWEAVQEAPFLDGLNPRLVRDAIDAGELRIVNLGRDMLLDTEGRHLLVCEGELALARFQPQVLERERRAQRAYRAGDKKAEKREQNRRQEAGPLIRLSENNLAVFQEGDLLSAEIAARDPHVAAFSVTPVKLLSLTAARMEAWRRTYQFFGDRVRNANEAARARIEAATGARAQVADFYVRHGMSIAMTLRVREVDKCIECYECEKACEARYGVKRLSLKGKVLGALDFVDCCRTCMDQRCVDVCGYDSIQFDPERKEVVINEESCTGCTMCAMACPYDAIEMHELDERPLLKLRLERENKLGFGEGKPRKAQIRRIASKCDHCMSYEDQACISACPTNALLEVAPESIFQERTEAMTEAAREGFAQPVPVEPSVLYSPEKFFKGLRAEDIRGRAVEQRLRVGWLWVISVLAFVGCVAEIALRKVMPGWSLQFLYNMRAMGLDPDMARDNVDYSPGCELAVWLGYIGAGVMFSSVFYSAHKWIPGLKKLGSQKAMLDYHIWAGAMGPLFILLHTAAKLDNWVSLAVWSMIATSISGLIGRYLTTVLPDLAGQAALRVLDLDRQLTELRNRHGGVVVADRYLEAVRRTFAQVTAPGLSGLAAGFLAFRLILRDNLARPFRALLLRRRLTGIKDRRARRVVAGLTAKMVELERERVLLPRIEPLFHEWKTIHIPFALVMSVLAAIHIVVELWR